jgi:hypothetical protein
LSAIGVTADIRRPLSAFDPRRTLSRADPLLSGKIDAQLMTKANMPGRLPSNALIHINEGKK